MTRLVRTAAGVSYLSLVLTHFHLLDEVRDAVADQASLRLNLAWAKKAHQLIGCPYCVSFWIALAVCKGRPVKAFQLAGAASVFTALVLVSEDEEPQGTQSLDVPLQGQSPA